LRRIRIGGRRVGQLHEWPPTVCHPRSTCRWHIADETDARHICGLPPTFAALEAIRPRTGKVLHYDRYVHPRGHGSASFASVGFYR
jgi:hypothetical protein